MAWASILGIAGWLAWAVVCVNVELMDGYAAIVNSQHFLGITDGYFWQRGPGVAWMLMPAEFLAHRLDLHPLDVRVHHALFALIHLAYLIGSWKLLAAEFGTRPSTLVAYIAAVPCFLFFSYAPFISHDLFPGVLTLWMFVLAARYLAAPHKGTLAALVAVGSSLALVKQTYALVWGALLLANALVMFWPGTSRPGRWQTLGALTLGAALAGLITWSLYGWALASNFPEIGWWQRPLQQAAMTVAHVELGGAPADTFDQWLYLRNLSAYGALTVILLLPGIYISILRGSDLQRMIAIGWLVLVASMAVLEFKEVRYLAFLAPMSAFLLVPAIRIVIAYRRAYAGAILAVWMVDLIRIVVEGARIRDPFYRETLTRFFSVLPTTGPSPRFVMDVPLSFVAPDAYAFSRDRYHRISSINADQIRLLYGYPQTAIISGLREDQFDQPWVLPGTILFLANDMATRLPPYRDDNLPWRRDGFSQFASVAEMVDLKLEASSYRLQQQASQPVILFRASQSAAQPMTSNESFDVGSLQALKGLASTPEKVSLLAFRMHEYCSARGCESL